MSWKIIRWRVIYTVAELGILCWEDGANMKKSFAHTIRDLKLHTRG
jgi:hypothetical protein